LREPGGVEALADRARIAGPVVDDGRAQRFEPVDRPVELLDDHALQSRVAVRALLLEGLERAVTPDDAAREKH
jgi:hypothetical protein